jgi:hypothetical protein
MALAPAVNYRNLAEIETRAGSDVAYYAFVSKADNSLLSEWGSCPIIESSSANPTEESPEISSEKNLTYYLIGGKKSGTLKFVFTQYGPEVIEFQKALALNNIIIVKEKNYLPIDKKYAYDIYPNCFVPNAYKIDQPNKSQEFDIKLMAASDLLTLDMTAIDKNNNFAVKLTSTACVVPKYTLHQQYVETVA